MKRVNLFEFLIVGHLVGDFLFQTGWMAKNKAVRWLPLLTHSAVYTLIVGLFALLGGGLSFWALAVIFLGHVVLDRKTFVSFWVRRVQTASGPEAGWLGVIADQIFHVLFLALAIYITNAGGL